MKYISVQQNNHSGFSVSIATEKLGDPTIVADSLTPGVTAALLKKLTSTECAPAMFEWPKEVAGLQKLTPSDDDTVSAASIYRRIARNFYLS